MKKVLLLFTLGFLLYGCGCLAQIPPQYVYVDENCTGVLPDYLDLVVVSDNCEVVNVTQLPVPGQLLSSTTMVEIQAIDAAGNTSSVFFNVILLDTIPPSIQLNPAWPGYTDTEVGDMYKTFYGWVQIKGVEINEQYAGKPYYVPEWDTVFYTDTFKIFQNTIPIPEEAHYANWWQGEGSTLGLIFEGPTKIMATQ